MVQFLSINFFSWSSSIFVGFFKSSRFLCHHVQVGQVRSGQVTCSVQHCVLVCCSGDPASLTAELNCRSYVTQNSTCPLQITNINIIKIILYYIMSYIIIYCNIILYHMLYYIIPCHILYNIIVYIPYIIYYVILYCIILYYNITYIILCHIIDYINIILRYYRYGIRK